MSTITDRFDREEAGECSCLGFSAMCGACERANNMRHQTRSFIGACWIDELRLGKPCEACQAHPWAGDCHGEFVRRRSQIGRF